MKKLLLITISLSIAYWGVLLAVEEAWTLPIPFLVIALIWYLSSLTDGPKYKIIKLNDKYGIVRRDIFGTAMLDVYRNNTWETRKYNMAYNCWTSDLKMLERYLEQLNNN